MAFDQPRRTHSGLWFSFGLVVAATVLLVWRHLAAPWIVWLFARGD